MKKVILSFFFLFSFALVAGGLAAERVKVLRDAFSKTLSDPALIADAQKRKWDLDPIHGAELEATAKEIMVQPPEVIERMRKLLEK